jgi:hypothetical protein
MIILCRIHAPDSTWRKVTVSSLELERPAKFRNFRMHAERWAPIKLGYIRIRPFAAGHLWIGLI